MESTPRKRIAIVGGGFSGIGCIVGCKEVGMEPVCFEQTDKFGGTWCYREESIEGMSSIMETTVINVSKEITAFSNFPPKKEYSNFMRHREVYEYACEFAEKRDVMRHMHFNAEVTHVNRSEDYDVTGKWKVKIRNTVNGDEFTDVFDGVMVCIGHVNRPKMANFPDQDIFEGKIMHTHSLKRANEFQNKKIVVVGTGCSGLDAAVESSNVAKQVYLSTRSGAHVMKRVGVRGLPNDYLVVRRYLMVLLQLLPVKLASWFFETIFLDSQFDHKLYAVKPKKPFLFQDPALSDEIAIKLHTGRVIQKPNIERFTKHGVIFEGETLETKADVVVMATGYTWKFPFLEDGIIVHEGGKIDLYKCVFPAHLQQGTLGILSFFLPLGPGFPLGELQVRWAAQVIAGNLKLPTTKAMQKEVRDRYSANVRRFKCDDKASLRVDYLPYMDDLASMIGAKPNLIKYLFTDFPLFMKLVFGPLLSYQYRLVGPNRWEGAREAIMTSQDRMHWPLQRRKEKKESMLMRIVKKLLRFVFLY